LYFEESSESEDESPEMYDYEVDPDPCLDPLNCAMRTISGYQTSKPQNEGNSNFPHQKSTAKPSNPTRNIPKEFENFLFKPTTSTFSLQVFKTCSDGDRKECAQLIVYYVISNPEYIKEYADITRDIVTSGSLSSSVHKTLLMHLIDHLTAELQNHFQKGSSKSWDDFTNIGKFLGQIYFLDFMKPALLYKWLDGVFGLVGSEPKAAKSYLQVLKIVMDALKSFDVGTFKKHQKNVTQLLVEKKIPKNFMPWTLTIANKPQPTATKLTGNLSKSSSMSSVVSEVSTTSKKSETPIPPTATTLICTNFQNFLNDLEAGKVGRFDSSALNSSEAAVRGCALILVEHAVLHPKNAKLYAASTANAIIDQIGSNQRFVEYLAQYSDVELAKWYKFDSPEKSNWERIKNVGIFLAELYNFKVLTIDVVSKWIEKICQKENEEAVKVALVVYEAMKEKLRKESGKYFEIHENLTDKQLIVKSFRQMMKIKPPPAQASPLFYQYQMPQVRLPMPQQQPQVQVPLHRMSIPLQPQYFSPMPMMQVRVPATVQPVVFSQPQSPYTFIQPTPPSAPVKNVFDELVRLVNTKLNFGNHAQIANEIAALKIPETDDNFRKIITTLVSRAKQRPDFTAAICEIIVRFSSKLNNESNFKNNIRLSLNQQFDFICSRSQVNETEVKQFVKFVLELHLRSGIGINVLSRVVENVGIKAKGDAKVSLKILLLFMKVRDE
jgi:hypothetical protein